MRRYRPRIFAAVTLALIVAIQALGNTPHALVVDGSIYDAESREPIPHATVQVVGTGHSALTNTDGRYRVSVTDGGQALKFSHIAYISKTLELPEGDSLVTQDVYLHPTVIEFGAVEVYSEALDPGQRIIAEAIRRKRDILNHINDYQFDAYTRLVIRDIESPDSSQIWILTETRTTSYWELPDKYKEVINARRQSANIEAENNLAAVGEILNFNRDRIELGRYAIVSPTARDALDHYNYYLADTVLVDSLRTFRLEIEPKNPSEPLFVGTIHIADSTFDVVAVDVGFSKGVELSLLSDLNYGQRFARFENEYWMPVEIHFSGRLDFEMSLPGIPQHMGFVHIASLHDYTFDKGHPSGLFDETMIEVADSADDINSTFWPTLRTIPLSEEETRAYSRIDSVESLPVPITRRLLQMSGAGMAVLMGAVPDLYHFNRAEGAYLGAAGTVRPTRELDVRLKAGYAFGAERTEWLGGTTYHFRDRRRTEVGFDVMDRIVKRPTIVTGTSYDPSAAALAFGIDPFDYHRAEGLDAFASTKVFNFARLKLMYHDYLHFSVPTATDYTVFERYDSLRQNSPISDGKLRSVAAEFQIDTRPVLKDKGRYSKMDAVQYTQFSVGVEHADPDFLDNDFEFTRYHASLYRRQRTFGLGLTSLYAYAGASDKNLPPQRYFRVDFGNGVLASSRGFLTLGEEIFAGNRVYAVSASHDFRRQLFVRSGLPLIKSIPLWLSIHGGAFWTEFKNHKEVTGVVSYMTAGRPYRELGVGVGNLTPFISPFNFAVRFTWQLSDYDTNDFTWFLLLQL